MDSTATAAPTQTTPAITWMPGQSVIGPLGTATRLPFVATVEITAQFVEMIGASANAPTTNTAEAAEMTTVRGVPMVAENNAVTLASSSAMVLVQYAKVLTSSRTSVKVTFGWQVIYEFEVWIMSHHAGVDLILGTEFMIPAGIRLDWLNSAKYSDCQVLTYEAAMDKDLLKNEQRLYPDRLASQPPAVERRQYAVPKDVVKRSSRRVENGEAELTCVQRHELLEPVAAATAAESAIDRKHDPVELKEALQAAKGLSAELSADSRKVYSVREAIDILLSDEDEISDVALADDPEEDLRLRFATAMATCEDDFITAVDNLATESAEFECPANKIDLEDYVHELAFLPDLTNSESTVLDYGGSNVECSAHTPRQREKLVRR
ncbi:unnamed protein product [Phytophthora fragariaefolia]|uniref:Unnamed protein product n=1 Tax=Phytophthora fragariaefolia TaxID=1490495 RepID=A0A9W7CIU9_9STRA|nr:unnamed protein product [Phytophthora fragariaefolia]